MTPYGVWIDPGRLGGLGGAPYGVGRPRSAATARQMCAMLLPALREYAVAGTTERRLSLVGLAAAFATAATTAITHGQRGGHGAPGRRLLVIARTHAVAVTAVANIVGIAACCAAAHWYDGCRGDSSALVQAVALDIETGDVRAIMAPVQPQRLVAFRP